MTVLATRSAPHRALGVVAALFLVSDIGHSFVFGALGTILLGRGVSLQTVALVNALGFVYFGRFLLGPLVDRYGSARFGHYRGWLVATQVLLVGVLVAIAFLDPVRNLLAVLALVTVLLALSAVHDTAMNGLSVGLIPARRRGLGNGIQVGAASASILLGAGGALIFYGWAGWTVTLLVLAGVFLIPLGVLARFTETTKPPGRVRLTGLFTGRMLWIFVILPFFALGLYLASSVESAMLIAAGWSLAQIGLVQYSVASAAGLVAGLLTGAAIGRWGRRTVVVAIGCLSTLGIAALGPLSVRTGGAVLAAAAVIVVTVAYCAMATWVYTVAMDLAREKIAATDMTVQVSMLGLLRIATSAGGLALASVIGFPVLIGLSALLAAAGAGAAAFWTYTREIRGTSRPLP